MFIPVGTDPVYCMDCMAAIPLPSSIYAGIPLVCHGCEHKPGTVPMPVPVSAKARSQLNASLYPDGFRHDRVAQSVFTKR